MAYREKSLSLASTSVIVLAAALGSVTNVAKASTHMCYIGPDSSGIYLQKIVPASFASSCEDCMCAQLKETCLLGPDSLGHYASSEVLPAFAKACPRETCTCSSHENYQQTYNDRIQQAINVLEIEVGVQFDPDIDTSLIMDGDANEEQQAAQDTTNDFTDVEEPEQFVEVTPPNEDDTFVPIQEEESTEQEFQEKEPEEEESFVPVVEEQETSEEILIQEPSVEAPESPAPVKEPEQEPTVQQETVQEPEEPTESDSPDEEQSQAEPQPEEPKPQEDEPVVEQEEVEQKEPSEEITAPEPELEPEQEPVQEPLQEPEQKPQQEPEQETEQVVQEPEEELILENQEELQASSQGMVENVRPARPPVDNRKEESNTVNLKDESDQNQEVIQLIFNGYNMLDSNQDTVDCRMGPNAKGLYIDIQISLMDYEMMCKQTIDQEFCDCDASDIEVQVVDRKASEGVIDEIYTQTITKEIYLTAPEDILDIEDESNQIAFMAGLILAVLVMGVVALIVFLVVRRKNRKKTQIVLKGRPNEMQPDVGPNQQIVMQEFQTPREIVGLPAPVANEHNMDISGRHSVMFGSTLAKDQMLRHSEMAINDPQDSHTASQVVFGASAMAEQVPIKDMDVVIDDYITPQEEIRATSACGQSQGGSRLTRNTATMK